MCNSTRVALKRAIDSWAQVKAPTKCPSICCKNFENDPFTTSLKRRPRRFRFVHADEGSGAESHHTATPQQACRYPLHHGGLCPRKDLVTCPFHGKIIPRDDLGRPLNPQDEASTTSSVDPNEEYTGQMTSSRKPDATVMNNLWEVLESDVMATGAGRKRGSTATNNSRKKQKQKSALIDVNKKPDTSYTRLNKQISTAKNKKLVQEAIEYEREMKSRNKEANNWHG